MFLGIDSFKESNFTTTALVLSFILLIFMPILLLKFIKIFNSIKSVYILCIWITLSIFYFSLLYWVFPGFVGSDDVVTSKVVQSGIAFGWQSLSYSFILALSHILLGGFGLTTIVSIVFFLFLSLKFFQLVDQSGIKKRYKILLAMLIFSLAVHPLNQALLLFHCRDSLFSLLLIYLGFQLIENRSWNTIRIIQFSILLIFLADLRQEAKVYLVLFPLFFILLRKWNFRQFQAYFLFGIFLSFGYYKQAAHYFQTEPYSFAYQSTAYILPLSQIFYELSEDKISTLDKENINNVLDIQLLKKYFSPVDIDPFHRGAFNYKLTDLQWALFKKSANSLLIQNSEIFLKNRIYLFKSLINVGHPPLVLSDDLRTNKTVTFVSNLNDIKLYKKLSPISKTAEDYRHFLIDLNQTNSFFRIILFSLIIPCLFLVVCIFSVFHFPTIGCFALIIAIRLPLLFLLAPANYLKYVYSVFLFFTFVPAFYLVHTLERKKELS